jgi:hypothetical protein
MEITKTQKAKMMSLMKRNCAIFAILQIKIQYLYLAAINLALNVSKFIHKIGKF